ncbi:hypothetical protein [Gordonia terrae]
MACCSVLLYLASWLMRTFSGDSDNPTTEPARRQRPRMLLLLVGAGLEIAVAWSLARLFGDRMHSAHHTGSPSSTGVSFTQHDAHHHVAVSSDAPVWLPDTAAFLVAFLGGLFLVWVASLFEPRLLPWKTMTASAAVLAIISLAVARDIESHLAFMLQVEIMSMALPMAFSLSLPRTATLKPMRAWTLLTVGGIGSVVTLWWWHVAGVPIAADAPTSVVRTLSLFLFGVMLWAAVFHAPPMLTKWRTATVVLAMQSSALLGVTLLFVDAPGTPRWDTASSGVLMLAADVVALWLVTRLASGTDDRTTRTREQDRQPTPVNLN